MKEKLFEKLKLLLKSNDSDENDFLFYPNLNPNNLEEGDKLMSNKLSKILKEKVVALTERKTMQSVLNV